MNDLGGNGDIHFSLSLQMKAAGVDSMYNNAQFQVLN